MLTRVQLPNYIAERFFGITIPDGGRLHACSGEALHTIVLSDPVVVEHDEDAREDYALMSSLGTPLGIWGSGEPILDDGHTRVEYTFVPGRREMTVFVHRGDVTELVPFDTFSGDWFAATLSTCGRYLVLAEPYEIEIYAIE